MYSPLKKYDKYCPLVEQEMYNFPMRYLAVKSGLIRSNYTDSFIPIVTEIIVKEIANLSAQYALPRQIGGV